MYLNSNPATPFKKYLSSINLIISPLLIPVKNSLNRKFVYLYTKILTSIWNLPLEISIPITEPVEPQAPAAIKESTPRPDPTSKTWAP